MQALGLTCLDSLCDYIKPLPSLLRVCCNALLAAYARAQPTQWPKAIRLLDLMWGCGGELCPDIVSYNTVIKACGNAGKVELGFKVRGD